MQCVLDAGRCGTNRSAQHYTARRGFEHRKFLQDANFKLIISDGKKRKRCFFLILLGSKYLIEDINRYEVYVYTWILIRKSNHIFFIAVNVIDI